MNRKTVWNPSKLDKIFFFCGVWGGGMEEEWGIINLCLMIHIKQKQKKKTIQSKLVVNKLRQNFFVNSFNPLHFFSR